MNKKIRVGTPSILGLFFVLSVVSCSRSSLENIKTKNDYLKTISALSEPHLRKRLENDLDSLISLKKEIDEVDIHFSLDMSMQIGNGHKEAPKGDSSFKINTDFNAIKKGVAEYSKNLEFFQEPMLPNSIFKISSDNESDAISKEDVDVKIKKLYVGIQPYSEDKVGLKKVDSITVEYSFEYPKSFETFKFDPRGKQEIVYNKQVIEINAEDEHIELYTPLSLAKDVLSYQALSPSGVLMSPSSRSAIPVITIQSSIKNDFVSAIQTLKETKKLKNKEDILKQLNKIPSSLFPAIAKYHSFRVQAVELDRAKNLGPFELIKRMKDLITNNKDLFAAEKQRFSLQFPDKVSEILLYIVREKEKISGTAVARARPRRFPYEVYSDRKNKCGIVDSNYNVIIPASYPVLNGNDSTGLYYSCFRENRTYYLDVRNKKLVPLAKGYVNEKEISDGLAVFADSNNYLGVLKNHEKVIVPFEYDKIEKIGNVLLLTKSKRGRKRYEVRALDNKLINELKGLDLTPHPEYGLCIIKDEKEKFGMIDKNGLTIIPPTYAYLEPIDKEPLLAYSEGVVDALTGIMKGDGTRLTEPKYARVSAYQEGFAVYRNSGETDKERGYLNKEGKPVFGRYAFAYGFAGGYALVFDNNTFSLIDTSGKKVKQIPYKKLSDPIISLTGKNTVYEIDEKKYNYAGQPIN